MLESGKRLEQAFLDNVLGIAQVADVGWQPASGPSLHPWQVVEKDVRWQTGRRPSPCSRSANLVSAESCAPRGTSCGMEAESLTGRRPGGCAESMPAGGAETQRVQRLVPETSAGMDLAEPERPHALAPRSPLRAGASRQRSTVVDQRAERNDLPVPVLFIKDVAFDLLVGNRSKSILFFFPGGEGLDRALPARRQGNPPTSRPFAAKSSTP